jgi:hypothetical protein
VHISFSRRSTQFIQHHFHSEHVFHVLFVTTPQEIVATIWFLFQGIQDLISSRKDEMVWWNTRLNDCVVSYFFSNKIRDKWWILRSVIEAMLLRMNWPLDENWISSILNSTRRIQKSFNVLLRFF